MAQLDLTTVALVKAMNPAITGTTKDALIQRLITGVSRSIEKWLDCEFLKASRTEVFSVRPGSYDFYLKAFPVDTTASFLVRNEFSGTWASVTDLDSVNYYVDYARARLLFRNQMIGLIDGPGTLRVVYTGGLAVASFRVAIGAITNGPFQSGETITGGTSGAIGVLTAAAANGSAYLAFTVTSGAFVSGEVITGSTSLASATTSAAQEATTVIPAEYVDLQMACEMQVLHDLQRNPNYGSSNRTVGGGGQSFDHDEKYDSRFIPDVVDMIEQYRRGAGVN